MDSWMGRKADPRSLHKYIYAGSNPVSMVDPSGKSYMTIGAQLTTVAALGYLATISNPSFELGQSFTNIDWSNNGGNLTSLQIGWLTMAAMSPANSRLFEKIKENVGESDETHTLYHGTDYGTGVHLLSGGHVYIDPDNLNWAASSGSFYLADEYNTAAHFAQFTENGMRDGVVVKYTFSGFAYKTIMSLTRVEPMPEARKVYLPGNQVVVPSSAIPVFNNLLDSGEITPGQ